MARAETPKAASQRQAAEKRPEQLPVSHLEHSLSSVLGYVRHVHEIFNRGDRVRLSISGLQLVQDSTAPQPIGLDVYFYDDKSEEIEAWPVFASKDQPAADRNPDLGSPVVLTYHELTGFVSRNTLASVVSALPTDSAAGGYRIPALDPLPIPNTSTKVGPITTRVLDPAEPLRVTRDLTAPPPERSPYKFVPDILGAGSETMDRNFVERVFENGATVIAGSDQGILYFDTRTLSPKDNEDRAVVRADNEVTVIDGMGGASDGAIAAQIIAETMAGPGTAEERLRNCQVELEKAVATQKIKPDAGAPMSHLRMNPDATADLWWLGDTRVVVISKNGQVKYVSKDQSPVQQRVDKGEISPYEALFHLDRSRVSTWMDHKTDVDKVVAYERIEGLEPGDRIYLMSDGISDNLTPEEIARLTKGKNQREAYEEVVATVTARMKWNYNDYRQVGGENWLRNSGEKTEGPYSDGFLSKPKNDNRTLVMIEVPAESPAARFEKQTSEPIELVTGPQIKTIAMAAGKPRPGAVRLGGDPDPQPTVPSH